MTSDRDEDHATPRYRALVDRLYGWADAARPRHGARMVCREGCDACCRRHLTVLPIEAEALARFAAGLPREAADGLARHLEAWDRRHANDPEAPCPLLAGGRCLLYEARPVICRTHGFPLRTRPSGDPDSGEPGDVVYCELNFTDAPTSPIREEDVLDIDRVNRALGAIQLLGGADRSPSSFRRVALRRALDAVVPGDG